MRTHIALLVMMLAASCALRQEKASLMVGGTPVEVEIADTDETRQTGLMNRRELGENQGMLFVFPDSRIRSFWMKNTPLPLSIAYLDEEGLIIDIKDMNPLDTSPVKSSGPARYALEMNRGAFQRLGVAAGDRIVIPESLKR